MSFSLLPEGSADQINARALLVCPFDLSVFEISVDGETIKQRSRPVLFAQPARRTTFLQRSRTASFLQRDR